MKFTSHSLNEFLKPRLWLGWVIGTVLWLGWLVSVSLGGGRYDYFGMLVCTDHIAFYSAARMIRDGEQAKIYDSPAITEKQIELVGERWRGLYEAYRNPPFYACLYWPTVDWPYTYSAFTWAGLSLVAIGLSVWLLQPERFWLAFLWVLTFQPTFASISYGQNSPFSLLILTITYRLMKAEKYFLSGMVAGLLCFKPTLLLGLVVFGFINIMAFPKLIALNQVARKPRSLWLAIFGLLLTVGMLCLASRLWLPDAWQAFIASLTENAAFDQMDWWKNLTPRSFWRLLIGPGPFATLLSLLTIGLGLFFYMIKVQKMTLVLHFAFCIPLTFWLSPHALLYEWLLLIIPAFILWKELPSARIELQNLFAFGFILIFVCPILSQAQLKLTPYAFHSIVPVLGAICWMAVQFAKSHGR